LSKLITLWLSTLIASSH